MVTRSSSFRAFGTLAVAALFTVTAARAADKPPASASAGASASASAPPSASASALAPSSAAPVASAELAPRLHHAPPAIANADANLEVSARIDRPDLVKRAVLVYRRGAEVLEVPFQRSSQGDSPYIAIVPAKDVVMPSIAYAIEIERLDGTRMAVFATREDMHTVAVLGDFTDAREQALLARLDGRRSVVTFSGEYVYFGTARANVYDGPPVTTSPIVTKDFADRYYRIEGSYTYRLLRTVAEFGIRTGIVRGRSVVQGELDPNKFDVGLNYGAPRLRLRATDWFHVEGEFLTSVTEVGFSVGGGGAVILGDPYATRLTVGFESIEVFGTRGYSRFDIVASRRLIAAPIIEVTNMPHAKTTGVRLLGEVGIDLGAGFGLSVRGGYQARQFAGGGASAGLTTWYAF